jgi:hypothetical protein
MAKTYALTAIDLKALEHSSRGKIDRVIQQSVKANYRVSDGETAFDLHGVALNKEEVAEFNSLFQKIFERAMSADGRL